MKNTSSKTKITFLIHCTVYSIFKARQKAIATKISRNKNNLYFNEEKNKTKIPEASPSRNHGSCLLPESPAHGLVVHVRLVLVEAPEAGHRLTVHQLEDPLLPVAPLDELGAALLVLGKK